MTLLSILVITSLLLGLSLHAQVVTIHVETPGTLSSYIPTNKYQITSLTLTGDLNGTDIRYIREMAGGDVNGKVVFGKLSVLDISGANIVAGGDYYYYDDYYSYPGQYSYSSDNTIGNYMFYNCTKLTSITIPNSVTSIGNFAFIGCGSLTSATIGNSVTSIGGDVFRDCSGLKSVTIGNSVASIGASMFSGCSGLSSVTIPNSATSIGGQAFYGCSGLTSVTIPNSVTSIGGEAFYGCTGLTSLAIGNSVTSIGNRAFYGCTALASIISSNSEPPVALEESFENVGANKCKIYVPVGSKQKYEEAIGWDKFSNIIESNDLGNINILLSISSGESGAIELTMRKGDTFTFKVVPSIGWKVNTVMYNTLDVTSQLDAQNQFTTPTFEANSTIRISFENTLSSVNQFQSNNTKVYSEGEFIIIEGAEPGETVSIYTESGALIQTTQATGDIVRINVPEGHVYLIKTVGKTFKIAL